MADSEGATDLIPVGGENHALYKTSAAIAEWASQVK